MDYFDSKVLESFMIPEESIATEGFGSKIIELGRKAINFLIAMITKLISILGNLINRFKHGKTVDIDSDTFAESVRLHGVIINELYYLLNNIPSQIYSLSYTASVISPSSIDEGFNDEKSFKFYHETVKTFENNFLLFNKKYKKAANELNGKTIYLYKRDHDELIKFMEDAKSRLNKTNEELKKALDKYLKNGENDSTKEIIEESQKRYAIIMKYSTQINTLFNNAIQLITQCVSPDVLT